jgi:NADH-quinone oxidoreductase subunit L
MLKLACLIPLFPAVGAFVNFANNLFGSEKARERAHIIGVGAAALSFLLACFTAVVVMTSGPATVSLYEWIGVGALKVNLSFLFDPLTVVMLLVVTGVGLLVHVYSIGYMHGDQGYPRFFACLNLFMFSMLILIMADNYLLMFVGWEGVGLCSYLLIGYWYQKPSATTAGNKAFIVNRIGDAGFLLGMFTLFATYGSLTYADIFPHANLASQATATAITLFLFVGAMGKSAQIPLYVWLPDAMEGPTPVSALIHAATMVTAGVYMVVRSNALYALAPFSSEVVAMVGAATALAAAGIALTQTDIKKVLAYSTVSQLGYMFLSAGVGAYIPAIFHLATHAAFKGLLFLGSGSVIHALSGEQDMRKMGGLAKKIPVTHKTFLIGTVAIAGIPPLAGFWSKDEILASAFAGHHYALWGIGMVTALMTSFYMFRLLFLTFYGPSRMDHHVAHHIHESPPTMTLPLSILAALSIVAGFLGFPPESGLLHHFLAPLMAAPSEHHLSLSTEIDLMIFSAVIALLGGFLAYVLYIKHPAWPVLLADRIRPLYLASYRKYGVDEAYDLFIVRPLLQICRLLWKLDQWVIDGIVNGIGYLTVAEGKISGLFDRHVVDGLVNFTSRLLDFFAHGLRRLQTGTIQHYLLGMMAGVVVFALYLVF